MCFPGRCRGLRCAAFPWPGIRAWPTPFLLLLAAAVGAAMAALGGLLGAVAVAAGLLAFWRCRVVAQRQFGGLSGDLAGWFVQRAELWMLLAAVMVQLAERTVLG